MRTLLMSAAFGAVVLTSSMAWSQTIGGFPRGVLTVRRPDVGATLRDRVRPETVRLTIDNQDFTSQAQIYGDRISWTPGYDLDAGTHRVNVSGLTYQGRSLNDSWSFDIKPQNNGGNVPYLSLTNQFPANRKSVGSRPSIGANFDGQLAQIYLWVDGQDFTRQARVTSNSIAWTPTYELDPGAHTARIRAVGVHGRQIETDSTFYVTGNQSNGSNLQDAQLSSRWPESNQSVGSQPAIGARFDNTLARVRLFVDGREYTNQSSRTDSSITWTPNYELDRGRHTVRVSATGRNGRTSNLEWPFQVVSAGNSNTYNGLHHDFGASSAVSQITSVPAQNESTDSRPAIGVHLPSGLNPSGQMLVVDGRDFTAFAHRHGSSYYWKPDYDLQRGWHHAYYRAMSNGQRLEQNWQFQVR